MCMCDWKGRGGVSVCTWHVMCVCVVCMYFAPDCIYFNMSVTFCYIQDGNTALLKACLNDHLEVAKQLCQGRPDINVNTPNKVSQMSMYASFHFIHTHFSSRAITDGYQILVVYLSTADNLYAPKVVYIFFVLVLTLGV